MKAFQFSGLFTLFMLVLALGQEESVPAVDTVVSSDSSTSIAGDQPVSDAATTTSNESTTVSEAAEAIRTRFGSLQVPLRIEGQNFTVRFSPERKSSLDVATQICTERGNDLGVTQENFDRCVNGVANYIQDYVDVWTNEKTLRFPITINETEFSLRFIPEFRDAKDLSTDLCNQYAQVSGLTFESEASCAQPMEGYIQRRINAFFAEKTLEVPLTINGNLTFNIRFLPERQSPVEVATSLCVNYATDLELTEETVRPNCISPVANFLADQVDRWIRSKTLEFSFQVNGKDYSVSFLPERTASAQVAQQFCLQNADALQLTNENFIQKCADPMNKFFQDTVEQWVESKRVTIPIVMGGKRVNVVFIPERESVLNVARNVCRQQAEALSLTEENFNVECVDPLTRTLREGLTNWVTERRERAAAAAAATPTTTQQTETEPQQPSA